MLTSLRMNSLQGPFPVGRQVRGLLLTMVAKIPSVYLIEHLLTNTSYLQIVMRVSDPICYQLYKERRG